MSSLSRFIRRRAQRSYTAYAARARKGNFPESAMWSCYNPTTTREETPMQMNPYLTFDGNCAEAMRFYQSTLGGKLEMMTFDSSPMRDEIPKGHGDKIMHACLTVDGQSLMASDTGPWAPFEGMKGMSVTLNYPKPDEAKPVFDALAKGGKVVMPFEKTFWAEAFGIVTDRFGTPWMLNAGSTT